MFLIDVNSYGNCDIVINFNEDDDEWKYRKY